MTPDERALLVAMARVLYQQTGDYELGQAIDRVLTHDDEIDRIGRAIQNWPFLIHTVKKEGEG
jgi:hypothetical protein